MDGWTDKRPDDGKDVKRKDVKSIVAKTEKHK